MRISYRLLLLVLAASWGAADVAAQFQGRLFTTPAERRLLDRLRADAVAEATGRKPSPAALTKALPSAEPLRFDGAVLRSDGPNTAWLDGRPVKLQRHVKRGMRFEPSAAPSGAVTLRLPERSRVVRLKPGQRYNPETGRVSEAFRSAAGLRGPEPDGP